MSKRKNVKDFVNYLSSTIEIFGDDDCENPDSEICQMINKMFHLWPQDKDDIPTLVNKYVKSLPESENKSETEEKVLRSLPPEIKPRSVYNTESSEKPSISTEKIANDFYQKNKNQYRIKSQLDK